MTPADLAKLDAICAHLDELVTDLQRVQAAEQYPYLGPLATLFRTAAKLDQDTARAARLEDAAGLATIIYEHIKRQRRGRGDAALKP